jgi:nucleoside-diphosphate-sugar epimerase
VKRILVTGADGFTGGHLVGEFLAHGCEVHGMLREPPKPDQRLPDCNRFHVADLDDTAALRAAVDASRPDAVIHLAAISFVGHDNVEAIYRTNLIGTHNLLSALAAATLTPASVLLVSSANVYGSAAEGIIDESAIPAPANDYAVSKLAMEHLSRLWADRLPITLVRPFNFIGRGQSPSFLVPKIIDHCRRRASVIELGNLDIERDFSDVRTVCEVYRRLLQNPAPGRIFNVCSGIGHGLRDILGIVSALTGWVPQVRVNPAFVRAHEVPRLVGSKQALESHIGAVEGPKLRETLAWMLED